MLFSVLIPTHNSANYLEETLASLRKQTFGNFEVVIIDDRSSDETPAIAARLISEMGLTGSVTVRPNHVPGGASGCRNIALGKARGEWVAFLDSDDLFAPNKLECVSLAIQTCPTEIAALYHKSSQFDDVTRTVVGEVSGGGRSDQPQSLLERLLTGNFLATCGMVLRRNLLTSLGGFDTTLNGVEDWWLVIRVSLLTPWLFLDDTLANIRLRPVSLMRNQPFNHYVKQHVALFAAARRSGELSESQLKTFRRYLLGQHTLFFAGRARSRSGFKDLLPGILLMGREGYASEAARLAYLQLRNAALSWASSTRRRLVPKRSHST